MTAILIISMMILMSCGKKEAGEKVVADKDGVKNFVNKSTPTDPTATLELKKLFTISGENEGDSLASFNRPLSLTSDKDGNIYILDINSMSLKKFDKDGKFVTSIGRRGQGPGELFHPSFVMLLEDTLMIMSQGQKKVSRFTTEGDFIDDKRMEMDVQLPKTYDNKNIISYTVIFNQNETEPKIKFSLSLLDKNLKVTNAFEKRDIDIQEFVQGKVSISDLLIPFTPGENKVFLSENDDNQYKVNVYDMDGNKTYTVKKQYKRIKYTTEEHEAFKAYMEKEGRGMNDGSMKLDNFKKAFGAMYYDKYGRLLIVPEVDRKIDKEGAYIDIFKDGIYLNRVDFEINKGLVNLGAFTFMQKQLFFIGERLYVLDLAEITVDVYDY